MTPDPILSVEKDVVQVRPISQDGLVMVCSFCPLEFLSDQSFRILGIPFRT